MELDLGLLFTYGILAIPLILFKLYMTGGVCHSQERMDGKTVVITGANTGIGKATARDLVRRGARVILGCRNLVLGETTARELRQEFGCNDRVLVYHLDLASLDSVRAFTRKYKKHERRLDVLINNAGVMWCPFSLTQDGFEMQIGVNHLGHFLLTHGLLDLLQTSAPSRVITLSSIAHYYANIKTDDLNSRISYKPSEAYAQSKLANVLFTRELAKRLKGRGVTTYAVHPGVVRSELGRYMDILNKPLVKYLLFPLLQPIVWMLTKNTNQGAQTSIYCSVSSQLINVSGAYYSDCMEQEAGKQAQDDQLAAWLWDTSMSLCGLDTSPSHDGQDTSPSHGGQDTSPNHGGHDTSPNPGGQDTRHDKIDNEPVSIEENFLQKLVPEKTFRDKSDLNVPDLVRVSKGLMNGLTDDARAN